MSPSSSDFVTADLRGMKGALLARARATGLGLSAIIRNAVARELDLAPAPDAPTPTAPGATGRSIQVAIRLTSAEAARLAADARSAGLSRGAYVGSLVTGVGVTSCRRDHVAALTASCAELSTLSRNLHHLATLRRQGSDRAAQEYDGMLGTLEAEVRRHLRTAADALKELSPRRVPASRPGRPNDPENHHG